MGDEGRFKGQVTKKSAKYLPRLLCFCHMCYAVCAIYRVDRTETAVLTQTSRAGIGVQFSKWIIARR